ncbi:TetR/AcrR family transcriptional regulator [Streptomyces sp. 7-21]|jgi:AcrR family transcriptional regulator|uniref:TetR/AcrR family transcriptional regulator n=1 Tax=Streptomyces sp. 7-21 TaxID=2802283 RepID=UPI00191E7DC7|nr:TetR/AcrR family transcriptional regulator [Streptomyces sp. 7-21]MBL1065127.1 TetR/AcrR family transcriptional regulator [Streptomyces sp. 7-21]
MNSRTAAPGPAYRRLSVSERHGQLIATAQRVFARRPPELVSLDDVAREAGVSRPLVYRYFPGGKQQLYEAALSSAAAELELCFAEPEAGPLSSRLANVLDRYLSFVAEHDEGFRALLKGGSVVETSRTTAIVDQVRRAAAAQVLLHLGAGEHDEGEHGPQLRMTVRTWIAGVEAASLIWLDEGRKPPQRELRNWLLDQLVAQLVVTAGRDAETARVLARAAAQEPPGGRVAALAKRTLAAITPTGPLRS